MNCKTCKYYDDGLCDMFECELEEEAESGKCTAYKEDIRTKLLNMIKDMKEKGYEAETIMQSIEVNLTYNKFE
jgi:hypothetical protein